MIDSTMEVSETSVNDNDVDQKMENNNDNNNEDNNDEDDDSEKLEMVQDVKEDVDVKIEPKETVLDEDGSTVEETYEITTTRRKTTTTTYKIQEVSYIFIYFIVLFIKKNEKNL